MKVHNFLRYHLRGAKSSSGESLHRARRYPVRPGHQYAIFSGTETINPFSLWLEKGDEASENLKQSPFIWP